MDTQEWKSIDINVIKFTRKIRIEWDEEGSLLDTGISLHWHEEFVL